MRDSTLIGGVLAVLAFGITLLAQPAAPPIMLQQSFTTGMVGFTSNQTARLNVLNLNSVPPVTVTDALTPPSAFSAAANCAVELQFFDDKNGMIKQTVVPNFSPGTAAFLDLPRASVVSAAAGRIEIRGVVVVNPAPTPVGSPAPTGYCSVMTTLEIYDAATGSTVALTSDTRPLGLATIMPVIVEGRR